MKKISRVTQKGQATIPSQIRAFLSISTGDSVSFEIKNGKVMISKSLPLDITYHQGLQKTLATEWTSNKDSAYDNM